MWVLRIKPKSFARATQMFLVAEPSRQPPRAGILTTLNHLFIYEHGILVIDLVPLWFLLSKSHILYVFCQIYTYTLHFESANRNGTVHIIPNSICSFLACKKAIDLNINVMPQFCYNCFLLIKYFHAPVYKKGETWNHEQKNKCPNIFFLLSTLENTISVYFRVLSS